MRDILISSAVCVACLLVALISQLVSPTPPAAASPTAGTAGTTAASAAAPDQLREKGSTVHIATDAENKALEAVMRPAFDRKFSGDDPDSQKLIDLINKI